MMGVHDFTYAQGLIMGWNGPRPAMSGCPIFTPPFTLRFPGLATGYRYSNLILRDGHNGRLEKRVHANFQVSCINLTRTVVKLPRKNQERNGQSGKFTSMFLTVRLWVVTLSSLPGILFNCSLSSDLLRIVTIQ